MAATVHAAGGHFNVQRNGFAGSLVRFRGEARTALPAGEPLPRLRTADRIGDAVIADKRRTQFAEHCAA